MSDRAVILSAVRTPVGRYGGGLAGVRPDDLAAVAVRAAVDRAGVPDGEIEDVWLGCANQAGEDNRNVARMAVLLAGLPESVAGVTVNRLCASGLAAVVGACHAVIAGDGDLFVAGGVESMTRAPLVTREAGRGVPARRPHASTTRRSAGASRTRGWRTLFPLEAMGETGENVAERWTCRARIRTRSRSRSQQRWAAAAEAGRFDDELVPAGDVDARRASAARHVDREARDAEAGVPRRRHGHRRQLVRAERRRGGARDRLRGEGARRSASSRSARSPARRSPASIRA